MSEIDSAVEAGAVATPDTRPGLALAEARARSNLSVVEVAQQLKLSPGQVEALEADAYERLPGPVFVRGFVRNYARLLHLDAEMMVAALNLRPEPAPAPVGVAMSSAQYVPFPEQHSVKWKRYAAALLLLVAAVVLVDIFISAPQTVVVLPPPSQPEVTPAVPAPVMEPASVMEPAPVIEPPAQAETQAATPVSAVVPAAAPIARKGMAELRFVFEAQSWVEVRDGNNRQLFAQLNPAGTEQHLQARLPLSVVVGNARGARLLYNGRPFDLAPHTRVEVARFTLE